MANYWFIIIIILLGKIFFYHSLVVPYVCLVVAYRVSEPRLHT
jgi:hypothetical protein